MMIMSTWKLVEDSIYKTYMNLTSLTNAFDQSLLGSRSIIIVDQSVNYRGGGAQQNGSVFGLHPAAPGLILHVPENNSMLQRFIDGPAQNTGQRLDNINQTHLVLARGKLVLQKSVYYTSKTQKKQQLSFNNNALQCK